MRIFLMLLSIGISNMVLAQTFAAYTEKLGVLSYPNKFDQLVLNYYEYEVRE